MAPRSTDNGISVCTVASYEKSSGGLRGVDISSRVDVYGRWLRVPVARHLYRPVQGIPSHTFGELDQRPMDWYGAISKKCALGMDPFWYHASLESSSRQSHLPSVIEATAAESWCKVKSTMGDLVAARRRLSRQPQLWSLGRTRFLGLKLKDNKRGIFFFHAPSDASYWKCDECGMLWWDDWRKLSNSKLPLLSVTPDGSVLISAFGKTHSNLNPTGPAASHVKAFHGTPPIRATKITLNDDMLFNVGKALFVGYSPERPSKHAGTLFIHHFGDTSNPTEETHPSCHTCGFVNWINQDDSSLHRPNIFASDNKFTQFVIADVKVGARGIAS